MERPKYRYHLAFQCTKNGHFRSFMTYYVNASSEAAAKRLVKEIYPDAKAFRIIGKWENTPRNTSKAKESAATSAKVTSAQKAATTCSAPIKTSDVKYVDPEEIVHSIWNKRKAEMVKLQKQLEVNHSQNLYKLTCDYEDQRKKLNKELALTEKSIAEESAHRRSLGLFRFEERKNVKMEIARLKARYEEISGELQDLGEKFSAGKLILENEKVTESKRLYQRAKENVPAPEIECNYAGYEKYQIEQQVRNNRVSYLLLAMEPGKRYTITDIQNLPEFSCYSNSMITSLFRHPTAQSHIVRTVEQGRAYYTLNIPK